MLPQAWFDTMQYPSIPKMMVLKWCAITQPKLGTSYVLVAPKLRCNLPGWVNAVIAPVSPMEFQSRLPKWTSFWHYVKVSQRPNENMKTYKKNIVYMPSPPPQNRPKQHIHWHLQWGTPFYDHSLHYYHEHKKTKFILDMYIHIHIYIYLYMWHTKYVNTNI